MRFFHRDVLLLIILLAGVASCAMPAGEPTPAPSENQVAGEPAGAVDSKEVAAVAYNLGEKTIVQSRFAEDSRFHDMPVRLNGVIAAPPGGTGPFPVVLIIHGTHHGCPEEEGGVDRWPCDPEVEQPNYRGFTYLVEALAAEGFVAIAPNFNAENTFGFGEGTPGERLSQLVDLHLRALAGAAEGGPNDFGIDLSGRADMSRLVFLGHSRGGEAASWLTNSRDLADPDAREKFGYGPVYGLLLLAPSPIFTLPAGSRVPLVVILPSCDGDVMNQEGQLFYEGARLDPSQERWALSVWLERANHNAFNQILGPDMLGFANRPDCQELLPPEDQRQFLIAIASTFLTTIFSAHPQAAEEAMAELGMNPETPAPALLFGRPARVMTLAERAKRRPLLVPASAGELTTNLADGEVVAAGVTTFFCEAGYYTPATKPGSEPCKRVNLSIPGNPAMVVVSWEEPGALLKLTLPQEAGDMRNFTAISMRAAVDPTSPLNAAGRYQALAVQLTDKSGASAVVRVRPDEPALAFPTGKIEEDEIFEGGLFSGRVPMTTIRLPLSGFVGVDLSQISEIALLFDQTGSGTLFLGDLELVEGNPAGGG